MAMLPTMLEHDRKRAGLYARDDAPRLLAELLIDLEDEVGEIARPRLVDSLRNCFAEGA